MYDMKKFRLDGKVALVTGASYGIGYAIASGLAAAGAKIVFNDINEDLVNKGLEAYAKDGIEANGKRLLSLMEDACSYYEYMLSVKEGEAGAKYLSGRNMRDFIPLCLLTYSCF